MRYPAFLKKDGRIGFIAPSFGVVIEPYYSCFENALKKFSDMGYRTVLGPNVYADLGIGKSNTPQACADEINDFFINDRSDVIISCGGGETMCEDLAYVDFDSISRAVPKWFMGYSDNTNLTFTLPVLCDTAAIYGHCASSFGMNKWHDSIADAMDLLSGRKLLMKNYDSWEIEENVYARPLDNYNLTEKNGIKVFRKGKPAEQESFSGRLLGGCMDCLSIMCGTSFDKVKEFGEKYRDDGIIWFLEAYDYDPMGVWRVLWQMDNAGWFKTAKGFIFGRPKKYGVDFCGLEYTDAVNGILGKYDVPVVLDADIGHLPPMMPLVSGAVGVAEAGTEKLLIDQKLI